MCDISCVPYPCNLDRVRTGSASPLQAPSDENAVLNIFCDEQTAGEDAQPGQPHRKRRNHHQLRATFPDSVDEANPVDINYKADP